jgi:hypothetical protein
MCRTASPFLAHIRNAPSPTLKMKLSIAGETQLAMWAQEKLYEPPDAPISFDGGSSNGIRAPGLPPDTGYD